MVINRARRICVFVVPVATLLSANANASGFALIEQGAKSLGNAYAGASALAADASTIYFNPAGLTRLDSPEFVLAGHYIVPKNEIFGAKATHAPNISITGENKSKAGVTAVVPNFYFSSPIAPGVYGGVGVSVPFGLTTNYAANWSGRYHAIESDVAVVSVTPTLALKPSENFSLGAGLNIEYAKATLSNRIDLGLVCLGAEAASQIPTDACAGLGMLPTQSDGSVTITGDNWSVGFVLGAMFTLDADNRIGVTYHSPMNHRLSGSADFAVPANAKLFTDNGRFLDTGAKAELNLPESLSASFFHAVNARWQMLGDVTFTKWSRFQELRVEFDNPSQPNSVQPALWENTWRYSLGANYIVDDRITLRTGVARDQTPVSSAELRTPRVPDSDRTWFALGVQWNMSKQATLDAGYAHLFVDKTTINNKEENTGYLITGDVKSRVDIASLQLTWKLP